MYCNESKSEEKDTITILEQQGRWLKRTNSGWGCFWAHVSMWIGFLVPGFNLGIFGWITGNRYEGVHSLRNYRVSVGVLLTLYNLFAAFAILYYSDALAIALKYFNLGELSFKPVFSIKALAVDPIMLAFAIVVVVAGIVVAVRAFSSKETQQVNQTIKKAYSKLLNALNVGEDTKDKLESIFRNKTFITQATIKILQDMCIDCANKKAHDLREGIGNALRYTEEKLDMTVNNARILYGVSLAYNKVVRNLQLLCEAFSRTDTVLRINHSPKQLAKLWVKSVKGASVKDLEALFNVAQSSSKKYWEGKVSVILKGSNPYGVPDYDKQVLIPLLKEMTEVLKGNNKQTLHTYSLCKSVHDANKILRESLLIYDKNKHFKLEKVQIREVGTRLGERYKSSQAEFYYKKLLMQSYKLYNSCPDGYEEKTKTQPNREVGNLKTGKNGNCMSKSVKLYP